MPDQPQEMRLDAWLWVARFFKTRSLAKQAIEQGRVLVDGQHAKPARMVRAGRSLRIERSGEVFYVDVLGLAESRGPASAAAGLYVESDDSRRAREIARAELKARRDGYRPPDTKPDKRARRLIRALGDIDAI